MRVLLDECVPKRLRTELADHTVTTVVEAGWSGIKNGQLLSLSATKFDCLLTVDRNLQFQQNASALPIAVIVVHALDNRYASLVELMPRVREALASIAPKQLVTVGV
jgi:predicted nuclease of predicted toxin-antitoxin system